MRFGYTEELYATHAPSAIAAIRGRRFLSRLRKYLAQFQ